MSMQVAGSADAVVGVAGTAPPVLSCWDLPGPTHKKKGRSDFQQKDCAGLSHSVAYMGLLLFFVDE